MHSQKFQAEVTLGAQVLLSSGLLATSSQLITEVQDHLTKLDSLDIDISQNTLVEKDCPAYIVEDLKLNIGLLHEFAPTLHHVADDIADEWEQIVVETEQEEDLMIDQPSSYFKKMIESRYPLAKPALVQHLAQCNWSRYQRIRAMCDDSPKELIHQAQEYQHSKFHDSGLGSSLQSETLRESVETNSQASVASFVSGFTSQNDTSIVLPPPPPEIFEGKCFTCQVCCKIVAGLRTKSHWK